MHLQEGEADSGIALFAVVPSTLEVPADTSTVCFVLTLTFTNHRRVHPPPHVDPQLLCIRCGVHSVATVVTEQEERLSTAEMALLETGIALRIQLNR